VLTYPDSVAEAANAGAVTAASCARAEPIKIKTNRTNPRIQTSNPIKHPTLTRIKALKKPLRFPEGVSKVSNG
jgi:hypothetical protein